MADVDQHRMATLVRLPADTVRLESIGELAKGLSDSAC